MDFPVLLAAILDILLTVWVMCIAGVIGDALIGRVVPEQLGRLERLSFGVPLGFGILSYGTMAVGLLEGLYRGIAWAGLGILTLVCAPRLWRVAQGLPADLVQLGSRLRSMRSLSLVCGGFVLFALLVALVSQLAPPTYADCLTYNLAAPARFVADHSLSFVPHFSWVMPFLTEMLYTFGMLLHRDILGTLFYFAFAPLLVIGVWAYSHRFLSERIGWISVALLFTPGVVILYLTVPKVDLPLLVYSFLALYALSLWREKLEQSMAALAGVMAGLAAGTKMPGLIVMLAGAGALLWAIVALWRRQEMELKSLAIAMLLFCVIASMVASPWYIRSWLLTGDPVWPLGYKWLGGGFWSEAQVRHFGSWTRGVSRTPITFLILPWLLTQDAAAFGSERTFLTPIFLAFLPALVLFTKARSDRGLAHLHLLGVFSLIYSAVWFWSGQQKLSWLGPILPPLSVLTAVALTAMLARDALLQWTARAGLAFSLAIGMLVLLVRLMHFLPPALGLEAREDYLTRYTRFYEQYQWMNENLPADARVLTFDLHGYYLRQNYIWGIPQYTGYLDYAQFQKADDWLEAMRALGVTHIFVTREGLKDSSQFIQYRIGNPHSLEAWVEELESEDQVREMYHNPSVRIIRSATFGTYSEEEVWVYELVGP